MAYPVLLLYEIRRHECRAVVLHQHGGLFHSLKKQGFYSHANCTTQSFLKSAALLFYELNNFEKCLGIQRNILECCSRVYGFNALLERFYLMRTAVVFRSWHLNSFPNGASLLCRSKYRRLQVLLGSRHARKLRAAVKTGRLLRRSYIRRVFAALFYMPRPGRLYFQSTRLTVEFHT